MLDVISEDAYEVAMAAAEAAWLTAGGTAGSALDEAALAAANDAYDLAQRTIYTKE